MAIRARWQTPGDQRACKGGLVSFPGGEQSQEAMGTSITRALNNEEARPVDLAGTFLSSPRQGRWKGEASVRTPTRQR